MYIIVAHIIVCQLRTYSGTLSFNLFDLVGLLSGSALSAHSKKVLGLSPGWGRELA